MGRAGNGEWTWQEVGTYLVQMLSWVCTTSDEQYP